MIDLYTAPTPNGHKASVTLEELGLEYTAHAVDLSKNEQKEAWFLELNPNGRIPVIVDHDVADADGVGGCGSAGGFAVFETGAIMVYLAEKAGRLLPTDVRGRSETMQWLMFQMGGVGPMMGQANVFHRYFPEKIPSVIARYQNESRRLFEVIERGLEGKEWLAADQYTIADIANFCWVRTYEWSGVSIEGLPNLDRWRRSIRSRPAVDRGLAVPVKVKNLTKDEEAAKKFAENARKSLQS